MARCQRRGELDGTITVLLAKLLYVLHHLLSHCIAGRQRKQARPNTADASGSRVQGRPCALLGSHQGSTGVAQPQTTTSIRPSEQQPAQLPSAHSKPLLSTCRTAPHGMPQCRPTGNAHSSKLPSESSWDAFVDTVPTHGTAICRQGQPGSSWATSEMHDDGKDIVTTWDS